MKGYVYILKCSDGSYYTGSTNDLERRLDQHRLGKGSNHTKKRLPVQLVYVEEYQRIDEAFRREKQIQGWSRHKKEALINNMPDDLKKYAECMNESHCRNFAPSAPFDTLTGATVSLSNCSVQRSAPIDSAQGAQGALGVQKAKGSPVAERSRSHRYQRGSTQ